MGRGVLTVAILVLIVLACLTAVRRLQREFRQTRHDPAARTAFRRKRMRLAMGTALAVVLVTVIVMIGVLFR